MVGRELANAREAVALLRQRLRAEGVPTWSQVEELAVQTGVPPSRVLREALSAAGSDATGSSAQAGARLLIEAVGVDADPGSWSTAQVLARLAKADPETAVDLLFDLLDLGVSVPVDELGRIADACAVRGRAELVLRCFDYVTLLGEEPNHYFWSYLLCAYEQRGDAAATLETYGRIPDPSHAHLTTAVKVLSTNGRVDAAGDLITRYELGGRVASGVVVSRYAAGLAETSGAAAVEYLRGALGRGSEVRPAMLTSILRAMQRRHDHVAALELCEAVASAGRPVSAQNLDRLATILISVSNPGVLLDLAPRLGELFGVTQWSTLIDAAVKDDERGAAWLEIAHQSGSVDVVDAETFTALVSSAVAVGNRAALTRLFMARTRPGAEDFLAALELPEALGDAELARRLVARMFELDVNPSTEALERAARSYRGSLSRVAEAYQEIVSEQGGGPPRQLAEMFIVAVLVVYAETNQATQVDQVLGKFDGWPSISSWDRIAPFVLEVAARRPSELLAILRSVQAALGDAVPSDSLLRATMLAVARTGQPWAMRKVLAWGAEIVGAPYGLGQAEHLRLANAYQGLLGRPGRPVPVPRPEQASEPWLVYIKPERNLILALTAADAAAARAAWRQMRATSGVPRPAALRYVELAASDAEVAQITQELREARDQPDLDIAEALDARDLRRGRSDLVSRRLVGSTGPITSVAARCYIAQAFEVEDDRNRVEARYQAYLPARGDVVGAEAGALLRAVAEGHATVREPERVRAAMTDLGPRVRANAQVWASLQGAYGSDATAAEAVVDEMIAAGVTPTVANHRAVLGAIGLGGRAAAALEYIEARRGDLTEQERAALLGQVVVMASSVDDLPLARSVRDLVLAIPAALPVGATRAYDAARRRAGEQDAGRLVSEQAAGTQIKLDSFVRDVAHDLNNKLNPLWVDLSVVEDVLAYDKDAEKGLEELRHALSKARTGVRSLLEHWQQVADDDAASNETADLLLVMRRLDTLLRPELDASGVRLNYDLSVGRFVVDASPYELDLMLRQLLTNSLSQLKKVEDDAKVIIVRAAHIGREDGTVSDEVLITVTDNGPGIDPAYRTAVFESGFSTRREKGVGRGLALVSQVVAACDGRISVESRTAEECGPGQTTFTEFQISLRRSTAV